MPDVWDNLAEYFDGCNAGSADNVEIIEPVLISELAKIRDIKLIDFGCGSGKFCRRVSHFSERILGVDSSAEMIRIAKERNSADNIEYTNQPIYNIDLKGFNVLNAECVIQFLDDAELKRLLTWLQKSGIEKIMISNMRLEFIDECIKHDKGNYGLHEDEYFITLSGNKIRFYPRAEKALSGIFRRFGFETEKSVELDFPESFLAKFPEARNKPANMPAYTVIVFSRRC